ncbi:hypothetical protein DL769_001967 [Monosporascus sp. CRB-8-3]|nr:hypothetical protein DL769_001967 [Monosporascus sp. CRB-8-3]
MPPKNVEYKHSADSNRVPGERQVSYERRRPETASLHRNSAENAYRGPVGADDKQKRRDSAPVERQDRTIRTKRVIEQRESPSRVPGTGSRTRRRTEDWADDEPVYRRETTADRKIEFRHGVVHRPEPPPRGRGDSPGARVFKPQSRESFYGQPPVLANRRSLPPVQRESRNGPRVRTIVGAAPVSEASIEALYPKRIVRYPPPPDMLRYSAPTAYRSTNIDDRRERFRGREEYQPRRPTSYGPMYGLHEDELDRLERLRPEEIRLKRRVTPPAVLRPRARTRRDMPDAIDELDILEDEDMVEEIEKRIRRKVEHDLERRMAATEREKELLRREVEEATRRKIEEERRAAEEAKERATEERNRIEGEVRERIEAERRAAAEAREAEARRNEEFAKLAQTKLQQGVDEIVALTREKILQDLGAGKQMDTGKHTDRNQLRAGIQAAKAEKAGRRDARGREVERREANRQEAAASSSQRLPPGCSARLSDSPARTVTPPPARRRHRRPSSSDNGDSWAQRPADVPKSPSTGADTESERHMVVTSSSRSTITSRSSDWSAHRRRRRGQEVENRERKHRKTLRIIREELVDPIAEALAAGLAGIAHQHAPPMPPPFYRHHHWRPSGAGGCGSESSYERPSWDSESYYSESESGDETVTPRGYTRTRQRSHSWGQHWREGSQRPPLPSRGTSRGRRIERWQQGESSSSHEHPAEGKKQDATFLNDNRMPVEAEPTPALVKAAAETTAEVEREDAEDDVDDTTEAETIVEAKPEPIEPPASPPSPFEEENFIQADPDGTPTEVNSEVLLDGLDKEGSVIHADVHAAENLVRSHHRTRSRSRSRSTDGSGATAKAIWRRRRHGVADVRDRRLVHAARPNGYYYHHNYPFPWPIFDRETLMPYPHNFGAGRLVGPGLARSGGMAGRSRRGPPSVAPRA